MNTKKVDTEHPSTDSTIAEIIEIVRLTKSSREAAQHYEDKTRPIISSKNYGEEVKILQYTH